MLLRTLVHGLAATAVITAAAGLYAATAADPAAKTLAEAADPTAAEGGTVGRDDGYLRPAAVERRGARHDDEDDDDDHRPRRADRIGHGRDGR